MAVAVFSFLFFLTILTQRQDNCCLFPVQFCMFQKCKETAFLNSERENCIASDHIPPACYISLLPFKLIIKEPDNGWSSLLFLSDFKGMIFSQFWWCLSLFSQCMSLHIVDSLTGIVWLICEGFFFGLCVSLEKKGSWQSTGLWRHGGWLAQSKARKENLAWDKTSRITCSKLAADIKNPPIDCFPDAW